MLSTKIFFFLEHIYNAQIKISSASQYSVIELYWNKQSVNFKHCGKSDKITKINYQQSH